MLPSVTNIEVGRRFRTSLEKPGGVLLLLPPLLDVFFLLLIFVTLAGTVILLPGITIDLPEGDNPEQSADKLIISLTRERLIFFNDQPVENLGDLENKLLAETSDRGRPPVIILRADAASNFEDVTRIMTITRRHGMRVLLPTQPGSRQP